MHFLSEKTKSKLQSKQSDQLFDTTPDTCSSCVYWFSLWMLSSKFLLPLSMKIIINSNNNNDLEVAHPQSGSSST